MIDYGPLYIKPLGVKTTERERRAGYEYARANLHEIEDPQGGSWAYFTTDPTDPGAPVYSIARPGTGGESSRFGDNAYAAATYDNAVCLYDRYARADDSTARYFESRSRPDLAGKRRENARKYRELAQQYRDAAESIRSQWSKTR